jgi:hypothetical protein
LVLDTITTPGQRTNAAAKVKVTVSTAAQSAASITIEISASPTIKVSSVAALIHVNAIGALNIIIAAIAKDRSRNAFTSIN